MISLRYSLFHSVRTYGGVRFKYPFNYPECNRIFCTKVTRFFERNNLIGYLLFIQTFQFFWIHREFWKIHMWIFRGKFILITKHRWTGCVVALIKQLVINLLKIWHYIVYLIFTRKKVNTTHRLLCNYYAAVHATLSVLCTILIFVNWYNYSYWYSIIPVLFIFLQLYLGNVKHTCVRRYALEINTNIRNYNGYKRVLQRSLYLSYQFTR